VNREIDGFIVNRLQGALLSEALRLVGEGYVSTEDLDKTVAHGLGLRWSFIGPLATAELNAPGGIADYCARYGAMYRAMAESPAPPVVWDREYAAKVAAAAPARTQREQRMAWRDRRLLALARHRKDQDQIEKEPKS
jgi:3-hydroxyacyl-CoA dehydrogenase